MSVIWAIPQFSKNQVKKAGVTIRDCDSFVNLSDDVLEITSNWRASHGYPLNIIQKGIRRHAKNVYHSALVSQRLKRFPSIALKLKRSQTMKLTTMQDIAGCRVIVRSTDEVYRVAKAYMNSDIRHGVRIDQDYILHPKRDGYRSLHLVTKYYSEKRGDWNGLLIEIQIRTLLQHSWATAVETVDLMHDQSLKFGKGSYDWARFFKIIGSLFSRHENGPRVAYTPKGIQETRAIARKYCKKLDVFDRFNNYKFAFNVVGSDIFASKLKKHTGYFVMQFHRNDKSLNILDYKKSELSEATERYQYLERTTGSEVDVVLVNASRMHDIRRAYPNYFLDTDRFLTNLSKLAFQADGLRSPHESVDKEQAHGFKSGATG